MRSSESATVYKCFDFTIHRVTEIGSVSSSRMRGTVGTEIATFEGFAKDWSSGHSNVGVVLRVRKSGAERVARGYSGT